MPTNISVENNFIGGLKTEFTSLNFPENACTDTQNCVFSIIGDVFRREGLDFEANAVLTSRTAGGQSINYYRWLNAGGDGSTQILVVQIGNILYFFRTSFANEGSPISAQILMPTIDITNFLPAGSTNDPSTLECQFTDGNGYLFVFHSYLDPFYVQYIPSGPAITSKAITIQIRDFFGISPEPGNPTASFRPTTLSDEHNYNLQNQGWTNAPSWTTSSTTSNLFFKAPGAVASLLNFNTTPVSETFTVASGLPATTGTAVNINWSVPIIYQSPGDGNYSRTLSGTASGTVTSYSGTTLVVNVTTSSQDSSGGTLVSSGTQSFSISASNLINTISTWHTAIGNYPSNADIWWEFKDAGTLTGENGVPTFNPAVTIAQIPLSSAQAPQGHFLLNAFTQQRSNTSGVPNLTDIITPKRPRTGTWFQGRVWYTGVDDSQPATGDEPFYTWTENIYFSTIVSSTTDFGLCFQTNDPTDDRLFDLLPDDGGVIVIQGSGPIFKLFPIQNGLLVFAANGIWLIRGNSGLGFTANDFSINKISSVKSISSTSYVDVLGLPMFWNNEGIYLVSQQQAGVPYGAGSGGLIVEPLTVGTILSYYNNIPFDSKRYARGAYDPISYVVSWVYRSTDEQGLSNRYQFDTSLNLNVHNRAFYPYVFGNNGFVSVGGIVYMDYPSGSLDPQFKYLVSTTTQVTFAEERDNVNWVDWFSFDGVGVNYTSSFTTGYKVHGQGFRRWQPIYATIYSKNSVPTGYNIQGIWDYATGTTTGKTTTQQVINNPIVSRTMASGIGWPDTSDFGTIFRRHRIPGHGTVLQLKVSSIDGMPFEIAGWSIPEQINVSA